MKPLRFGVLGAAKILEKSMAAALKVCPKTEFIGVAARDPTRADKLAKQFGVLAFEGYDKLLSSPDIDAVYIPLPVGLHAQWAIRALKAGKHVLVEKSFASTHAETVEVIECARQSRRSLAENFMCASHPQHKFVKDVLVNGEIGKPRFFEAAFTIPARASDDIRNSKVLGGGALNDLGAYTLRMCRFFFGDDAKVLSAKFLMGSTGVDESGSIHLSFADRVECLLHFGFGLEYVNEYKISCSSGLVHVRRAFSIPADMPPAIEIRSKNVRRNPELPPDNQFVRILEHFNESVRSSNFERSYSEILNQSQLMENVRGLIPC